MEFQAGGLGKKGTSRGYSWNFLLYFKCEDRVVGCVDHRVKRETGHWFISVGFGL